MKYMIKKNILGPKEPVYYDNESDNYMVINEYYNGKWNRGAPKYKRLSDTI